MPTTVKRMTAQQPAQGQPAAAPESEALDGLDRVRTTAGCVATSRGSQRADHSPVEPDPAKHRSLRGVRKAVHCSRPNAASKSWPSVADDAPPAPGSARTTTADPARESAKSQTASGLAADATPDGGSRCRPRTGRRQNRRSAPMSRYHRKRVEGARRRSRGGPAGRSRSPNGTQQADVAGSRRAAPGEQRSSSGRQLAAALAATRREDRPAGSGAHAQPEAVRLGAAAVVGLKSPLAHGVGSKLLTVLVFETDDVHTGFASSAAQNHGDADTATVRILGAAGQTSPARG